MKRIAIDEEMLSDPPFIASYLKQAFEDNGDVIAVMLMAWNTELGPVPKSLSDD